MVKSVLKIYLLFLSIISYGQSNQEIESAEFIVEKDKDLELPKRERIFEYVKPIPTLATFDSLTFISAIIVSYALGGDVTKGNNPGPSICV